MALSTQEALSNCYDQSTPSGEGGGDPFDAAWNKMAFDNAYANIHSGMKALEEMDYVCHALLMVLFTNSFKGSHVDTILTHMYQVWRLENEDANLKPATLVKVEQMLTVCLQAEVFRQSNKDPSVESICRLIGINRADWSKKGRPAQWKVWFNQQRTMLEEWQSQGSMFLQPYIQKTENALRRRYH